jgi:hypothetical protein
LRTPRAFIIPLGLMERPDLMTIVQRSILRSTRSDSHCPALLRLYPIGDKFYPPG